MLRINTESQKTGNYVVTLVTDESTPPTANGFYLYDVNLNVEIGASDVGVMQSLPVDVYLTDDKGYRIDDLDFLKSLSVELEIINQQNMGVEVDQEADADEITSQDDVYTEKLQLYNDSFRLNFCTGACHGLPSDRSCVQRVLLPHLYNATVNSA